MASFVKTSFIKGIKAVSICSSVLNPRSSAGSLPNEITIDSTGLVIGWLAVFNEYKEWLGESIDDEVLAIPTEIIQNELDK